MDQNDIPVEKELAEFIVKELKEKEFEKRSIVQRFKYVYHNTTLSLEIFNSISHGIGALIAIAQLVLLAIKATGPLEITSVTIFGASSVLMFLMSCLYHAFIPSKTRNLFQRFDHISIYLLIAGTYTPFALLTIGGAMGWALFGIQWGLATIGIVFKSIWIKKFQLVHLLLFILMGWSIVFFDASRVYALIGFEGFLLLLGGGIAYTLGVIFYVKPITKYHHTIWHFFVILGNILHFFSLYFYVLK